MNRKIIAILQRIPASPDYRTLIAWIMVLQGLGYVAIIVLSTTLTTTYLKQAAIMPIWAWAALFMALGIGLLATKNERWRRGWTGRGVALSTLGMMAWQLTTFAQSGGLTAVGWLLPCFLIMIGETLYVEQELNGVIVSYDS